MDDDKDQLISVAGDSDGPPAGEDKVVDPDLLDEMDDAAELEDDSEEEGAAYASAEDEEDEDDYNLDNADE